MDWSMIAAIVAALGGREFFVWLANLKSHSRKEEASAKDAELSLHEKQIVHYEQRLTQRDAKVDAIYNELREEQRRNLQLIEEANRLRLEKEILLLQKCEVRGCEKRKPPGDY